MRLMVMLSVLSTLVLSATGCGDVVEPESKDLRSAADLFVAGVDDLTIPPDLTPAEDLTPAADLAVAPDMAAANDTVDVMVGPNFSLTFAPQVVNIKVGQTVRWTWASSGHNVVSGKNAADNVFCSPNDTICVDASLSNAGFVYRHKFNQAGSFSYFCAPHLGAGMTGTVNVK